MIDLITSIDETLEAPIFIIANNFTVARAIVEKIGEVRGSDIKQKCIPMESHNLSERLAGVWEDQMYFDRSVMENPADLTDNDIKFLKAMNQDLNLREFSADPIIKEAQKIIHTHTPSMFEKVVNWLRGWFVR